MAAGAASSLAEMTPRSIGGRLTARPRQRREQPETVPHSAGAGASAQWALLVEDSRLAPPPCDTSAKSNVRAPASQTQVRWTTGGSQSTGVRRQLIPTSPSSRDS